MTIESSLATKVDLVQMKARLLRWFIGTAIAMTSLAFAAGKWIN